jgi:hypothetical protein
MIPLFTHNTLITHTHRLRKVLALFAAGWAGLPRHPRRMKGRIKMVEIDLAASGGVTANVGFKPGINPPFTHPDMSIEANVKLMKAEMDQPSELEGAVVLRLEGVAGHVHIVLSEFAAHAIAQRLAAFTTLGDSALRQL